MILKYKKAIIFSFTFWFAATFLFAGTETPVFNHLTTVDGLSSNTVISICQDSVGFLWYGTYNGLNRYDGFSFKIYTHDPSDLNSLSNNAIQDMIVTRDSILWLATDNGLCSYNHITEKFTCYYHDTSKTHSLGYNKVRSLFEYDSTHLLIGTYGGGLDLMNRTNSTFTHFSHDSTNPKSISNNTILDICKDSKGRFWIGTQNGLNLYQPDETFLHFFNDPSDSTSLSNNVVNAIFEDHECNIWIGNWGADLSCLKGGYNGQSADKTVFKRYHSNPDIPTAISHNFITDIKEDYSDRLWISTQGGGINIYDSKTDSFIKHMEKFQKRYGINNNMANVLLKDKTGIMWVGTYGGINKTYKRYFECFSLDPSDSTTFFFKNINAFYVDTTSGYDIVWIGSLNRGLCKWDRDKNNMTTYTSDPGNPFSLPDNRINAINRDSRGCIWVGTGKGLSRLEEGAVDKAGKFYNYFPPVDTGDRKDKLSCSDVFSIYEDHEHILWVGTFDGGLNRLNLNAPRNLIPDSAHFDLFTHNPDSASTTISGNTIRTIFEDSSHMLWVGTQWGGINRFDRTTGHFSHNSYDSNDTTTISDNYVRCIFEDHLKNLWFGTTNGLNKLIDRKTLSFSRIHNSQISLKDKSASNSICGILEDRWGNCWLSTDIGIARYVPEKGTFVIYGPEDGLQGKEFVNNAYAMGHAGVMYFGRRDGLNLFHPDSIEKDTVIPPLKPLITEVVINDIPLTIGQPISQQMFKKNILKKSILLTDTLYLTDKENVLSFKISSLNFRAPEYNRYRYRLNGFDSDWKWLELTDNRIYYNDLPDGDYTLEIEARNREARNREVRKLILKIKTPFFKTFLFYVSVSIILFISIILILIYSYKAKKRADELKDVNRKFDRISEMTVKLISLDSNDQVLREATDLLCDTFNANTAYFSVDDENIQSILRLHYSSPSKFEKELNETADCEHLSSVYRVPPTNPDSHLEIPVFNDHHNSLAGYFILLKKEDKFKNYEKVCINLIVNIISSIIRRNTGM